MAWRNLLVHHRLPDTRDSLWAPSHPAPSAAPPIPLPSLPERHGSGAVARLALKRAFDIALSGVGLVVSAPLWPLIGLAIKLDDGGSVFFLQIGRAHV